MEQLIKSLEADAKRTSQVSPIDADSLIGIAKQLCSAISIKCIFDTHENHKLIKEAKYKNPYKATCISKVLWIQLLRYECAVNHFSDSYWKRYNERTGDFYIYGEHLGLRDCDIAEEYYSPSSFYVPWFYVNKALGLDGDKLNSD